MATSKSRDPNQLDPNQLVKDLAAKLKPPAVEAKPKGTPGATAGTPDALAFASDLPELVTFAGFLGARIPQSGVADWRLLYLDWRLHAWLLVEDSAIVHSAKIKDEMVPAETVDVIWVREDAAVRRGNGSQSVESRFLTGSFTRAGDFDAPLTGGTLAAATGVFCEARTPFCCHKNSR